MASYSANMIVLSLCSMKVQRTHLFTSNDLDIELFVSLKTKNHANRNFKQWRTQEFFSGGGSTNSVEDRENGDLGAVAP